MNFIMKLNFYGPVNKQGIIKKVISTTYNDENLNVILQKISATTSANATPTSDYTYIDTFEDF